MLSLNVKMGQLANRRNIKLNLQSRMHIFTWLPDGKFTSSLTDLSQVSPGESAGHLQKIIKIEENLPDRSILPLPSMGGQQCQPLGTCAS